MLLHKFTRWIASFFFSEEACETNVPCYGAMLLPGTVALCRSALGETGLSSVTLLNDFDSTNVKFQVVYCGDSHIGVVTQKDIMDDTYVQAIKRFITDIDFFYNGIWG